MNTLIASMDIGVQVTISKSEVQMISNIMNLNFSQAVVVQFWIAKNLKPSQFDLQETGESPRDPMSQRAATQICSTEY